MLTALGAGGEWRLILGGIVTLFFAVPFVALMLVRLPNEAAAAAAQLGGAVRKRRLLLLICAAVLAAASSFVIVTYIAPVVDAARSGDVWLTTGFAMLAFGVGMNLGNLGSGWLADRTPGIAFCGVALAGASGAALFLVPDTGGCSWLWPCCSLGSVLVVSVRLVRYSTCGSCANIRGSRRRCPRGR
ncbi:hypothetical protein [Leucobacter coleopterorum]|uniref:hypothetical protein n=1 Tax=Leucobacter coleopterorum TaxID=2714933 RepID=UPI001FCBF916|nr:hypothetical protein [Leucobacter coleopterorum]